MVEESHVHPRCTKVYCHERAFVLVIFFFVVAAVRFFVTKKNIFIKRSVSTSFHPLFCTSCTSFMCSAAPGVRYRKRALSSCFGVKRNHNCLHNNPQKKKKKKNHIFQNNSSFGRDFQNVAIAARR